LDVDYVMRRIKAAEHLQCTATKTPKSRHEHHFSSSAHSDMHSKGLDSLN
jgi:hypothetical protein